MKKLAITMMSMAMIMLVVTTVHSVTTNEKPPFNDPGITYLVNIEGPDAIGLCNAYYVTITDRNGDLVASPQYFQEGTLNYVFHESGPVTGKRIASLVKIDAKHHTCSLPVYAEPVELSTRFRNNVTYIFTLQPTVIPVNE